MYEIGQEFGRATLLVDAINDATDDVKTNNFNAWQAATDIPKDLEIASYRVADIFEALKTRVSHFSDTAYSYINSAENTILPKLGTSKPQRKKIAFLQSLSLFACFKIEENCDGSKTITFSDEGWLCIGCLGLGFVCYCCSSCLNECDC